MESLPNSLRALLTQASQASAAKGAKALPRVAAHHQAVQQELILGEADEWQCLLVGLLPSLKQVQLPLSTFPVCWSPMASSHWPGSVGTKLSTMPHALGVSLGSLHVGTLHTHAQDAEGLIRSRRSGWPFWLAPAADDAPLAIQGPYHAYEQ